MRGVPPNSSTAALAAIAAADPISAWHPPSAPATVAFRAIIDPTIEAFSRALASSASLKPCCSCNVSNTAGITPADPAVGAATIRPIAALVSRTATALRVAEAIMEPRTPAPKSSSSCSFAASPPINPPIDLRGDATGASAEARITSITLSRYSRMVSAEDPRLANSARSRTSAA